MEKIASTYLIIFLFTSFTYSQWEEQQSGVPNSLRSVSIVDENIVWVSGLEGTILKSTNGGVNWVSVGSKNPVNNHPLESIWGLSASTAIVKSAEPYNPAFTEVYRTSNGGDNWLTVFHQDQGFIDAIAFKDTLNGIIIGDAVGGRWSIWKTSDGGITWDSAGLYLYGPGETSWNKDIEIQGDKLWFGTDNYKIYYSSNFGNSWMSSSVNQPIGTITMNGNIGFAANAYVNSNCLKTTNGGLNWFTYTMVGYGGSWSSANADDQYWLTNSNNIYYSPDGLTFSLQHSFPFGSTCWQIKMKRFNSNIIGWVVRDTGKITKYNQPIGIKPKSTDTPEDFSVFQNYPNPFNPKTIINYQ